jgi:hypothetical protein
MALFDTRTSSREPVKKLAPAPSCPNENLQPGVLDKSDTNGHGGVEEDVHAEVSPAFAHPAMLAQLTAQENAGVIVIIGIWVLSRHSLSYSRPWTSSLRAFQAWPLLIAFLQW